MDLFTFLIILVIFYGIYTFYEYTLGGGWMRSIPGYSFVSGLFDWRLKEIDD
jgi:hypothetical protein